MYEALWRALPGPIWLRALIVVVLAAAVLTALVLWVFPWVNATFFIPQDVTVEGQ